MDNALVRTMAEREASHWWFVGKGRILRRLITRYAPAFRRESAPPQLEGQPATHDSRPTTHLSSLDVGCGGGGLLAWLAQRSEAWGMDISEESLTICREKGLNVKPGSLPNDVPFDAASFDVVVASDVVEHVEDDAGAAKALLSLVRPGGILVTTVPAFQWMWSRHDDAHHHFRRYTRRSFLRLFDGLPANVELASYCNTTFFPLMAGARVASRILPSRGVVEVKPPPRPINTVMGSVFGAEGAVMQRVRLPFGGSVAAVIRKR